MSDTRLEIMWGTRLLDDGFTSIPNILIRSYRKLGIEHGEWGFICTVLTFKHDQNDPYPSRKTLAEHLCCSERQIEKWVSSLVSKNLLLTGQRKNSTTQKWDNRVFNFKPLLDACMRSIGDDPLPDAQPDFTIVWDKKKPSEPEVPTDKKQPREPQVHTVSEPEVHAVSGPEVHTKKKRKKEKLKDDDYKKGGYAPSHSSSTFYDTNKELIELFLTYAIQRGLHEDYAKQLEWELANVDFLLTQYLLGSALNKTLDCIEKNGCNNVPRYFITVLTNDYKQAQTKQKITYKG